MRKLSKYTILITLSVFILSLSLCSKEQNNISQARKHFEKKEYEEALAFYEEAIKNNEDVKDAEREIVETLYQLGNNYYKEQNHNKTILSLERLITLYPETPYREKAADIIKLAYGQNIQKLFSSGELKNCLKQINKYKQSYSITDKIQEIETKVNYNIALNHYNKQEYFLANTFIKKTNASSQTLIDKTQKLKEKILFYDGQKQFLIKAYANARKTFKELLVSFPKSRHKKETEKYLKKIDTITKISYPTDNDEEKPKNTGIETLEKKGYEEDNPYNKNNIIRLIKYFKEEREKNEENLKQNIFPPYKDKYVKLTNLSIDKYTKNNKTGIIEPKTRSKIDSIINWETNNKIANYEYTLHLKNIPSLLILLKKEDFLKLNFKKPIKRIEITASILSIEIANKKIRMFIVPLKLRQK